MKQIVQTGPETVEVQQGNRPSPDPNEVLVRVHTAGLCGSDAHAYRYDGGYEWIPIPRIMGHEYSGEVVAVGDGVTSVSTGQRVVEEPIHHCGDCFQCDNGQENVCQNFSITGMHRDGAYAEYTVVEPQHLHSIPDGVDLGTAAITEPTSIAARAVFDRSSVTPGDTVLVEGPGPIGSLIACIADSMGANVLVSGLGQDTTDRLPRLASIDIDTVDVESESLEELVDERTDGLGFDVVFDTTGHRSGIETAVDVTRKGGQVVVVGLPGDPSSLFMTPIVRSEIEVNTSYGSTWTNFEQALRLMENGAIDPDNVVDTSFSVSEPAAAFEAFLDSKTIKPLFNFDEA
ncbi:zinc-dependent alcohol dehydrogenase [Halocatena salina]|uniref:Alcohol dehydrogenase catalytic domain-containing protein n=1 Tax=Halocatena salina TaxID=2934340 RepID=A0A8U0A8B6_9EURY|nr:alcohol dehydrogenase catalytic domain-containing protein [Halocatena salina]UPM44273.1 alcohol dehydrogenase catalytic domain-containing protein [Halocatena salina]